jgi:DtxR family manganese transport transcriptional regulator
MLHEEKRAKAFLAAKDQNLQETVEDYTELIADLIQTEGKARIGRLAAHLGISHVSALRTMERLKKEGYVTRTHHFPIYLTEKGAELAQKCKKRHELVYQYLLKLGVPEEVALIDAEGMEHHLSEETVQALEKHLKQLS